MLFVLIQWEFYANTSISPRCRSTYVCTVFPTTPAKSFQQPQRDKVRFSLNTKQSSYVILQRIENRCDVIEKALWEQHCLEKRDAV